MKRIVLLLVVSFMLLSNFASVAGADTWYHPNSGDYWYCDYYGSEYWCYGEMWQGWFRGGGPDILTRNGWWAV